MADEPVRSESPNLDGDAEECGGKSVLVKNLKFETPPSTVRKTFEKFGPVRDVYLPLDYFSRRPRGFGFVEFVNAEDAGAAVKTLHGTLLDGNEVTVLLAQDRRKTVSHALFVTNLGGVAALGRNITSGSICARLLSGLIAALQNNRAMMLKRAKKAY